MDKTLWIVMEIDKVIGAIEEPLKVQLTETC